MNQATVPYELRGGPNDGEIAWLPPRAKWYVTFGGYRHAVYVSETPTVLVLHYRGTAATREEAEDRAESDAK